MHRLFVEVIGPQLCPNGREQNFQNLTELSLMFGKSQYMRYCPVQEVRKNIVFATIF